MKALSKDTATSTAHVNATLNAMGYDVLNGGRDRNRFKDGFRVHKPSERFGAIPVTITSRRRTYDVQAEMNKIVTEFTARHLEVHDIVVAPDNKHGSFNVLKEFTKGKTADGKGITRITGRYWFIQVRSSLVWAVQTDKDSTDLRTVDIDGTSYNKYPFTVVAEMRRNLRMPEQKNLHWAITVHGKRIGDRPGLTAAREDVCKALLNE